MIQNAYNNHKEMFSDSYHEQDFSNMASFQHKITGET